MENKQYYKNYQNFTQKGERLAVFGVVNGNSLHILTNKCSKKDQFSKKLAKKCIESYLNGAYTMKEAQTFKVNIDEKDYTLYYNNTLTIGNDRPEWLLNQYCLNNYYGYKNGHKTVFVKTLVKNIAK